MAASALDVGDAQRHHAWGKAVVTTPHRTRHVFCMGGVRGACPTRVERTYPREHRGLPQYTLYGWAPTSGLSRLGISQRSYGGRDSLLRLADLSAVAKAMLMAEVANRDLRAAIAHHHRRRLQSYSLGEALAQRRVGRLYGRRVLSHHLRMAVRTATSSTAGLTDSRGERLQKGRSAWIRWRRTRNRRCA